MKRVVVDRYGGPETVSVVEEDDPVPGPGQVRVKMLASGVSITDAQIRAGTYLGGPKPPFTPGYELVGVVDELGPGCSRLRVGDRIGALTQWGANAECVCVPEKYAVQVPKDLDPAQVLSLVFTHMTAYQLIHRAADAKSGETVLLHGAAGRVGTAVLELAAATGLQVYGTASAGDRDAVERHGAVFVDYRSEDFLARVRELTSDGVNIALDQFGGITSLRSLRALSPGGRLVLYGAHKTVAHGRKAWRGLLEFYTATPLVALWGSILPRRRVLAYQVQKLRVRHQDWFQEDFDELLRLLRAGAIRPVVAERLPLSDARRAHEMLKSTANKGKLVLVP